jgi:NADPH-dependent glutamate synthase beta subunit-like oxidoreductase
MISDTNIFVKRDTCYACGICIERCIMDNLRMYLAPCRAACPIHMNCQGYVRLIAQGKEKEAAQTMRKDLPFAGIVGRVCTHPCELKCERAKVDGAPVSLRALKRFLADSYPEISHEPAGTDRASGKRVAIVGSGPAGLMAAHDLATKGHSVTVFDSASEPGGMLRWGIPSFRLPKTEVANAIRMLEEMGVEFQSGKALGREIELEQMTRQWDAVFLAIGAGSSSRLGIHGEDLEGVYSGIELLRSVKDGQAPFLGKSAIVIGGGNTAVDAALASRRLGTERVRSICLEKKEDMPAFKAELAEATEEGIEIQDCFGPRRIVRSENGHLRLELSRCMRVFDDTGRFNPTFDDSFELSTPVDSVIIAIGQKPDFSCIPGELLDKSRQRLIIDPVSLQTKYPTVFAGGDVVSGSQSVIEALAHGREAAISLDRILQGETLLWGRQFWDGVCITDFAIDHSKGVIRERVAVTRLPSEQRDLYTEVEKTLDQKTARLEAERCLNCGYPAEVNQTCWYCLPCEIECPVNAIEVRLPYLVR